MEEEKVKCENCGEEIDIDDSYDCYNQFGMTYVCEECLESLQNS